MKGGGDCSALLGIAGHSDLLSPAVIVDGIAAFVWPILEGLLDVIFDFIKAVHIRFHHCDLEL